MKNMTFHQRWLLEAPKSNEDTLHNWLLSKGCTATYHEMAPPYILYAYFPPGSELPSVNDLDQFSEVRLLQCESFADDDWLARSREEFKSIEIGRKLRVHPVWIDKPTHTKRTSIIVNPGLAFGTGGHETTRLCMSILEDVADKEMLLSPVLDIGTGTGILALTAHILGAKNITAFDYDPDSEIAIKDLLKLNCHLIGGNKPFSYFVGTIDDPKVSGLYSTIIANLFLETIQEMLPKIRQISAPGGLLIASGILSDHKDEALISLTINNFKPIVVTQEGDWIAILAKHCHG